MNPLAPCFVPRARSRDSVTPKARPPANTRSGVLPPAIATAASLVPSPDLLPYHRQRVHPAKLAAQLHLVESLLPAATAPSRSGSITPRARRGPTPSVLPVPHEVVVTPAMVFTGPATPARMFNAMPAPSTGGTSAAGLLAHIARVQDQVAGLFARRLRDEVDRVPEAEMQRLETARWWVVHGALLSVMHLVYMHESDEVRRRFEWAAWQLALNMPGEEGEKAREKMANGGSA